MVSVCVTSRHRVRGVRQAQLRVDAARLLRELRVDAELSVALVSDEEMRRLNRVYRRVDQPTDVLAFALREGEAGNQYPQLLGDVVISVDSASRQAAQQGISTVDEVRMLLIHGLLHLLGYDHERSPAAARRMFRRQRQLIGLLVEKDRSSGHWNMKA